MTADSNAGNPQDALVLPIGHYVGAYYPEVNGALRYRKLRIAVDIKQIASDKHFAMWALAHGLPDRLDKVAWTRSELLRAAAEREVPDPEGALDELIKREAIAEVVPGTPGAVDFARTHRVQPLMLGLGNTPQDPLSFGLGFVGMPPVVRVNSFLYELWQWGRIGRSLWQTVEMFAKVEHEVTQKGRGVPDPERILGQILGQVHVLLAHNAAYLDQVLPEPTAHA